MIKTKRAFVKLGAIFELFSKGLIYNFALMLVFTGACIVLYFGRSENLAPQALMLYWLFAAISIAITTVSWLPLRKNKLALCNLFSRVKPYIVGLVMIAVMTFFNLAFWSIGCLAVDKYAYNYVFDTVMFSGLYLLTPIGILGFLSIAILPSIALSAFVLGKFTNKKFWFIDLVLIFAAFILSITTYSTACIVVFALATVASIIDFVLACVGRVDYEVL